MLTEHAKCGDRARSGWRDLNHDLFVPNEAAARHTTATLLLEDGVDAHIITPMIGHSDVVVTRGHQHVDPTLARSAMPSLSELLA